MDSALCILHNHIHVLPIFSTVIFFFLHSLLTCFTFRVRYQGRMNFSSSDDDDDHGRRREEQRKHIRLTSCGASQCPMILSFLPMQGNNRLSFHQRHRLVLSGLPVTFQNVGSVSSIFPREHTKYTAARG